MFFYHKKAKLMTRERRLAVEFFMDNAHRLENIIKLRKLKVKEKKPVSIFLFDLEPEEKVIVLGRLILFLDKSDIQLSIDMIYVDYLRDEEWRFWRSEAERIRSYTVKAIKDKVSEEFYYWFVGLMEGFQNKAFMRNSYYKVWFNLKAKDQGIVRYICDNLKLSVNNSFVIKKKTYSILSVEEPSTLRDMSALLFGTLYLQPYLYDFRFWSKVYNSLYPHLAIIPYHQSVQSIEYYTLLWVKMHSWFSGYFDAIGLFQVIPLQFDIKTCVIEGGLAFVIPMRDPAENKLITAIHKAYNGRLLAESTLKYKSKRKLFFRIDLEEAENLLDYFSKYPLNSDKKKIFNFFKKIFLFYRHVVLFGKSFSLGVDGVCKDSLTDITLLYESINSINKAINLYSSDQQYIKYFFFKPLEEMYLQVAARLERKRVRGKKDYWAEEYADVIAEHINRSVTEAKKVDNDFLSQVEDSEERQCFELFLIRFLFFSSMYNFGNRIKLLAQYSQSFRPKRPFFSKHWDPLTDRRRAYADSDWHWFEYLQYLEDCQIKADYDNYIAREKAAYGKTLIGFTFDDNICLKIFS